MHVNKIEMQTATFERGDIAGCFTTRGGERVVEEEHHPIRVCSEFEKTIGSDRIGSDSTRPAAVEFVCCVEFYDLVFGRGCNNGLLNVTV